MEKTTTLRQLNIFLKNYCNMAKVQKCLSEACWATGTEIPLIPETLDFINAKTTILDPKHRRKCVMFPGSIFTNLGSFC